MIERRTDLHYPVMAPLVLTAAMLLAPAQAEKPKRPVDTEALVDRVRGTPPEFAADLLLRLASSARIPERGWRIELVEEAFVTAANAQFAAPRSGRSNTDSRFGPVALAARLSLDRLSLQAQAAEAMLALQPRRALELFREIRLQEFKPVSCREVVAEHPGQHYYELVPKLFASSFSAEDRRKAEDIALVSEAIRSMRADSQIEPVAKMVESIEAGAAARQQWLNEFGAALKSVRGTDRTFTANVWIGLDGLAKRASAAGLARGSYLGAVREFVISRINGPECDDMTRKTNREPWIQALNREIQTEIERGNGELRPIAAEELKPGPRDGTFDNPDWWRSERSIAVLEALRWLNHGNRDLPQDKRFWTLEERSTQQWNDRHLELLKLLEDWKPSEGETKEDTYHMKAVTYELLARLVPPGPSRTNAIRNLLAFLDASYHDITNRAEWFTHVWDIVVRGDEAMREEAGRARNPIIALYAAIGGSLK